MHLFFLLLCLLLLLYFALILAIYWHAFRRSRRLERRVERSVEASIARQHRAYLPACRDWLREHPHETVETRSDDGLTLRATYVPCAHARGTLLCFHGWRSSSEVDFGAVYAVYHDMGLNLLLADQRAHGRSEGRFITFGVRERRDVRQWVHWHGERFGAQVPVLMAGLSMGATTVLMACGEPLPASVRGVLADCGFTSPEEIVAAVGKSWHLPAWSFVPALRWLTRHLAGFDLREYSTLEALQNSTLPLFLAHGEADTFVPCYMSRRAYAACPSEDKTLLLVPGAAHGQSYLVQPERYTRLVRAFLDRVL